MGVCDQWLDDFSWDWKKIVIGAAVVAVVGGVIAVLVLAFAVVKPPKATATDAVLQRFALTAGTPRPENSTVSYNITAVLSLRNPNIYRGISYDPMDASFYFNGARFFDQPGFVRAMDHGARKTVTSNVKVGGVDRPIRLSAAGVKEFDAQKEAGKFDLELKLDTKLQYKGRKTKCPLSIVCPLKLQLVDPDVAATAFQITRCTILRAKQSGC